MKNKYLFSINTQTSKVLSNSSLLGLDVSIVCEEEDDRPPHCSFTSPHLTSLSDPTEIWARALSLISLYNGATNLNFNPNTYADTISNIKLTRLYIWETAEDITPQNTEGIVQKFPFCNDVLNGDARNKLIPKDNLTHSIYLARKEEDIRNLLLQLGNGLDWINLYSILDSVKTYSKKNYNKVLKGAKVTVENVKAFTGTANNYGLIGVSARHGHLAYAIPSKIMTLKESQTLVLALINSYLKLTHQIE